MREGDSITVDAERGVINVDIPAAEVVAALARGAAGAPVYIGVFAKYCALVASASEGAMTTPEQLQPVAV